MTNLDPASCEGGGRRVEKGTNSARPSLSRNGTRVADIELHYVSKSQLLVRFILERSQRVKGNN